MIWKNFTKDKAEKFHLFHSLHRIYNEQHNDHLIRYKSFENSTTNKNKNANQQNVAKKKQSVHVLELGKVT